jgi:hypothetical protein
MKKSVLTFVVVCIAVISLHAFRGSQTSGIKGMIVPADANVTYVWAVNGIDSIKVQPVKGEFALGVKAGTYKLIVDADAPYKDAIIENIVVKDAVITDVGEIRLGK